MLVRFADLAVASDVPLPGLPAAAPPPAITIQRGASDADGWTELQTWPASGGDPWLTIDRGTAGYRLRFSGFQCVVSHDGSRIEYDPPAGLQHTELTHLLLHQVLPLAVSRPGRMVLHACAVETPRGITGILGESGSGKSTLAAAFCARGAALVADDALVLDVTSEGVVAWPTANGIRLSDPAAEMWPAAVGAPAAAPGWKRRVPARLAASSGPLVRVYLVGEDPGPLRITPVAALDARIAMLSNLFRLDVSDEAESRVLFDRAHQVAARVPMRRLIYPDGFELLDGIVAALLADLDTA